MSRYKHQFKLLIILSTILMVICIFSFPIFAQNQLTFLKWKQDKNTTMYKYQNYYNDQTITTKNSIDFQFTYGDKIATITIPKMDIYESPIYYGSDTISNNWQITTPGHIGNWSLFGEKGVTCIGAHNYQVFKELYLLQPGDKIIIETDYDVYVYIVDNTGIYNHLTDNWNSISTKHKKEYALNLMTCYPFDAINTDDMYIVYTSLQRGTIIP